MSDLIPIASLNCDFEDPRVMDLELAAWLGLSQPLNIRTAIAANRAELEMHGEVFTRDVKTTSKGGRPGKAYWLNEGQALVICALSRTEAAARVRKALIEVFMAYRAGKLVHVKEHRRRMPSRPDESDFESVNDVLQAFHNQPRALIEVLARCVTRLDRIGA